MLSEKYRIDRIRVIFYFGPTNLVIPILEIEWRIGIT